MARILFSRAKGKGKTAFDDTEPDGDEAPQKSEKGNKSAPGPRTDKSGEQTFDGKILKSTSKATAKPDAAGDEMEPDEDDGVEASNVKKQASDKAKVSKKPSGAGKDATDDPTPAKGKARFGKPGSPIRF